MKYISNLPGCARDFLLAHANGPQPITLETREAAKILERRQLVTLRGLGRPSRSFIARRGKEALRDLLASEADKLTEEAMAG